MVKPSVQYIPMHSLACVFDQKPCQTQRPLEAGSLQERLGCMYDTSKHPVGVQAI